MKKIFGPILSFAIALIILFILSKVFPPLMEFLTWWFLTKESVSSPLSPEQIFLIDLITHVITYVTVGMLFSYLNWYEKKAMHIVYVLVSEAVTLGLLLILRLIIDYYWIVLIIVGLMFLGCIATILITFLSGDNNKEN